VGCAEKRAKRREISPRITRIDTDLILAKKAKAPIRSLYFGI
jgi:hypothetical protein